MSVCERGDIRSEVAMYPEEQLRLECLRLAVMLTDDALDAIERAKRMEEFVRGKSQD